ncbi:MAG: hypothetical protein LC799_29660, partial [Actinobacteria bacterium]|nr:hypothetical protein [Actinomycetota bacterium]
MNVAVQGSNATVEVRDDGVGFDIGATSTSAQGFEGGTLTIESAPGRGTRIAATLPICAAGSSLQRGRDLLVCLNALDE